MNKADIEAIAARLQREIAFNKPLVKKLAKVTAENAAMFKDIGELRAENERLWEQVSDLDDDLIEKDAEIAALEDNAVIDEANYTSAVIEIENIKAQNAALVAAIEAAFVEGWDCGSNENIQTFAAAWEHSKAKALTEAQGDE